MLGQEHRAPARQRALGLKHVLAEKEELVPELKHALAEKGDQVQTKVRVHQTSIP